MPHLVDTPKSAEQVAAYLADGQRHSVPAVQASDIGDGEILNATRTVDLGGGSYKFTITLPSGRPLESAAVSPDYSKRDAGLQWVEAVRGAILGDYEQAVEDAARAARRSTPVASGDEASSSSSAKDDTADVGIQSAAGGGGVADPVEYAKQQLSAALARLAAADQAEADVKKWSAVVAMLTGDPKKKRRKRKKPNVAV